MPAFLRIRYQFTQDRNWKNPEKRSPQKVLARRGHDSSGLCCAKRWRLSRFSVAGFFLLLKKKSAGAPRTSKAKECFSVTLDLTLGGRHSAWDCPPSSPPIRSRT